MEIICIDWTYFCTFFEEVENINKLLNNFNDFQMFTVVVLTILLLLSLVFRPFLLKNLTKTSLNSAFWCSRTIQIQINAFLRMVAVGEPLRLEVGCIGFVYLNNPLKFKYKKGVKKSTWCSQQLNVNCIESILYLQCT